MARELIRQRYRRGDAPQPRQWNETLDVLLSHRSVRAFLPDALPKGTVETLVAAAQSAPSSSNLQVWSVLAVARWYRVVVPPRPPTDRPLKVDRRRPRP